MKDDDYDRKWGLSPAKGFIVGAASCAAFYAIAFFIVKWLRKLF